MTTFYPFGGQQYYLGSSCGSTDTSILLSSFLEPVSGFPYTMTYLNTSIAYGTIAPKTTSSEFISFTGITQNTNGTALLTGVTRGLAKAYPFTSSSTFMLAHAGQSVFIISNVPQLFQEYVSETNNQTVGGIITFTQSPIVPDPTSGTQVANKEYVDSAISGGVGTATNTTFGTVKLSVAAVSTPNPIAVGNNDPRLPTTTGSGALTGTSGNPSSTNKYETENDTSNAATQTSTTISFTAPSTISDSGSGFVTSGFRIGDSIAVTGSASNNTTFTIVTLASGVITVAEINVVNETAGASDTIATVRTSKLVRADSTGQIPAAFLSNAPSLVSSIQTTKIAGLSITQGQPLTSYYYQTDGGIKLDNKDICFITTGSPGTTVTKSFTVGNNSNRDMTVFINANQTILTVTYGGVALTSISSQTITVNSQILTAFHLSAPAIGTANLVITLSSSGSLGATISSYYNVSQTSQPEVIVKTTATGATVTASMTTIANGALVLAGMGYAVTASASGSITSITNAPNNFQANEASAGTGNGFYTASADSGVVFPAAQTFSQAVPTGLGGTNPNTSIILLSFAPATVPVAAVVPSSSASVAYGQNKYTAFMGFANSTVSAGSNVAVIIGGIATGLSGLTPNTKYFLNDTAGTIGTSTGTNSKSVGIALSATTILVANMI